MKFVTGSGVNEFSTQFQFGFGWGRLYISKVASWVWFHVVRAQHIGKCFSFISVSILDVAHILFFLQLRPFWSLIGKHHIYMADSIWHCSLNRSKRSVPKWGEYLGPFSRWEVEGTSKNFFSKQFSKHFQILSGPYPVNYPVRCFGVYWMHIPSKFDFISCLFFWRFFRAFPIPRYPSPSSNYSPAKWPPQCQRESATGATFFTTGIPSGCFT